MASPFPPPFSSSFLPSFKNSPPADDASGSGDSSSSSSYVSINPSLFIISAIVAFVFCASASIHLLLRCLSARSRRSSSSPPLPLPLLQRHSYGSSSASSSSSSATVAMLAGLSNQDKAALIDSLPLFTLAAFPKASPDRAVCLYPFIPHDELRLLPACCHAFHSQCLDPWLRSTPSCPLCCASIALPVSPLPPPPDIAPRAAPSRFGRYRVEIGSVSRRGAPLETELAAGNSQPHLRTYTLGSSFEYVVNEEVEAVVELIGRPTEEEEKQEGVVTELGAEVEATPPGAGVAEAAGGGGGRVWQLRDCVDGFSSSLSLSPFSFRFSGRWSHRCDGSGGGRFTWDLEGTGRGEEEEGGHYG